MNRKNPKIQQTLKTMKIATTSTATINQTTTTTDATTMIQKPTFYPFWFTR